MRVDQRFCLCLWRQRAQPVLRSVTCGCQRACLLTHACACAGCGRHPPLAPWWRPVRCCGCDVECGVACVVGCVGLCIRAWSRCVGWRDCPRTAREALAPAASLSTSTPRATSHAISQAAKQGTRRRANITASTSYDTSATTRHDVCA